jgi:hypothetical protein
MTQGCFMDYKNSYYVQKQYEWSRKGKKYKTRYFSALRDLFGAINDDRDCKTETKTEKTVQGTSGTGQICRLAEEE